MNDQPDPLPTAAQQRILIQNQAFQAAINGEPLVNALNILAQLVKLELGSDVRTAFYLAYPDGKRLHAIDGAGDMASSYTDPLNGFPVGYDSFCSGYAMATGHPVHTPDVFLNPLWQPYRHMATAHGFRATSSYPILTRQSKAIGSLALYFPHVHQATAQEAALAKAITQAAAIILSQDTQNLEHTRAEEALRQSQEKYQTLFEAIDEGYAFCQLVRDQTGRATDYRILELNAAFEQQIGGQRADFLGRTAREVFAGYDNWWIDTYAHVVATNQAEHFEHRLDNTGRWYAISAYPRGGDHFAVIYNDITERRLREHEQAFLLTLGDTLRPLSDPATIEEEVTQLVREHLDAGWCYYVEWDETTKLGVVRRDATGQGLASLVGEHNVSDVPEFLELLKANPLLAVSDYEHYEKLTPALRQRYTALGFGSMLVATLVKQERLVASLLIGDTKIRPWLTHEGALLTQVAERTWAAVEQAKAEAALRISEAKYRKIFEHIDQGFSIHELIIDESGRVTDVILQEVNEAFEKHTGIRNAQGKKASEFVPHLEPIWLDAMTRAYQWGETQRFEAYNADINRWITSQYSRIGGAGSRLLTNVFTDVTERKQREQRQELVISIAQEMGQLTDETQLIRFVGTKLAAYLGLTCYHYVDIDEASNQVIVSHFWHALEVPPVLGTCSVRSLPPQPWPPGGREGRPLFRTSSASCRMKRPKGRC